MKQTIFWLSLALNVAALGISAIWIVDKGGYEAWIAAVALLTSTINLLASRQFWMGGASSVSQSGNVVGGDMAGGNISKRR